MATVRESHRRAAPLGAVDRIPWGDGAANIDSPRAPAIVFETSRTFSACLPQFQTMPLRASNKTAHANRQVLACTVYEHSFASRCFVASDRTDAAVRTT